MNIKILFINILSLFLFIHLSFSKDSLISADKITTDENNNVTAEGNVKIIYGEEIMKSN